MEQRGYCDVFPVEVDHFIIGSRLYQHRVTIAGHINPALNGGKGVDPGTVSGIIRAIYGNMTDGTGTLP